MIRRDQIVDCSKGTCIQEAVDVTIYMPGCNAAIILHNFTSTKHATNGSEISKQQPK